MFMGQNPSLLVQKLIRPGLSEWLSGCYVVYALVYPIVLGAAWVKGGRAFRETVCAVCIVLGVGYIGYNLVPAQGPIFTQTFDVSLNLYYTGFVKEQLMDVTRVPRDCFPSLHTGASLVMLIGALRHTRTLGLVLAPFVLSIPFACVYLRYHYVIDVIAGIVLAAIVWAVTLRVTKEAPP
jgi:membrane-associated phospholipid phosphatase